MYHFTPEGFAAFLDREDAIEPIRYGADMVDLTYGELQKVIHQAALDRKSHIATEALNLIADKFGKEAYNTATTDYQKVLTDSCDNQERGSCTGCSFYRPAYQEKALYANDHCMLLDTACKRVVKQAEGQGPGFCARSQPNYRTEHDDSYKGLMNVSQVSLT